MLRQKPYSTSRRRISVTAEPVGTDVSDPFGIAALRSSVLEGWERSPDRFREDANVEEDAALGAYRDRVVIELAQNAADAASEAGVEGRLDLELSGSVLRAANVGSALTAEGVRALSTMRASAKRDSDGDSNNTGDRSSTPIGRFGVGFSAVRSVADDIVIASTSGAVGWSLTQTRDAVAAISGLSAELGHRGDQLPVLRLPFPDRSGPPQGFTTVVSLVLRDEHAIAAVRQQLADLDAALLLAMPSLGNVTIKADDRPPRRLSATRHDDRVLISEDEQPDQQWIRGSRSGPISAELFRDRPVEERQHPVWSVCCAVPVDELGAPRPLPASVPAVLHAPTPTDERLDLPALAITSHPLDPGRRHVAEGPLAEHITEHLALAFVELVATVARDAGAAALDLVPGPLAVGGLDGQLRRRIRALLPDVPMIPLADNPGFHAPGRDVVVVDGAGPRLVEVLAPALPGLLAPSWAHTQRRLEVFGVSVLTLADVLDLLMEVSRQPHWWRTLYDALADQPELDVEMLAALPVPLADGRTVRGPRGLLVPELDDLDLGVGADVLGQLGVRLVHPDAAHPLLERLGALPATARSMLTDAAVREAVAGSGESAAEPADLDALVDLVLHLVRAADLHAGDIDWLSELTLATADGERAAAGELVLPGSVLAAVSDGESFATVAADLVARWGSQVLEAVGVSSTFTVVVDDEVPLDPDAMDHDLDAEPDWLDEILALLPVTDFPPVATEFRAVRDLDLVRPDAWPAALRELATPPQRSAVTDLLRVIAGGQVGSLLPYSAWWLSRTEVLDGHRPIDLRLVGSDPLLSGLYADLTQEPESGAPLDDQFVSAIGVRSSLGKLLHEPGGCDEVLDRLADERRDLPAVQLLAIYAAIADLDEEFWPGRPSRVRIPSAGSTRVVPAAEVVVLTVPFHAVVLGHGEQGASLGLLPGSTALAEVLDLPDDRSGAAAVVHSTGVMRPVPEAIGMVLPGVPTSYVEHDELVLSLPDGSTLHADAWVDEAGTVHASTSDGLGRALAWVSGAWQRRWDVASLIRGDTGVDDVIIDTAFDPR
jgi:hypothetical protein